MGAFDVVSVCELEGALHQLMLLVFVGVLSAPLAIAGRRSTPPNPPAAQTQNEAFQIPPPRCAPVHGNSIEEA